MDRIIGIDYGRKRVGVAVSDPLRAIISSEHGISPEAKEIRFALKPNKVFLFDKSTEERLPFTAE